MNGCDKLKTLVMCLDQYLGSQIDNNFNLRIRFTKIFNPPSFYLLTLENICTALYFSTFGVESLKWLVMGGPTLDMEKESISSIIRANWCDGVEVYLHIMKFKLSNTSVIQSVWKSKQLCLLFSNLTILITLIIPISESGLWASFHASTIF